MHITRPLSRHFDPTSVIDPANRGAVAWQQFNAHYPRMQANPWIETVPDPPRWYRWLRRIVATHAQRSDAFLDLARKARLFASLPVPRDPDIVFFGAEVGWEAFVLRAVFGDAGRIVLVDCDLEAFRRFESAPRTLRITGPDGRPMEVHRDPATEYIHADFFDWSESRAFDIGIDWGLLEHFPAARKPAVLERFRRCLRPGGYQLSAVPRDTFAMRWFYRLFADELNFGYRELLTSKEHRDILTAGGFAVTATRRTPSTCIALARPL